MSGFWTNIGPPATVDWCEANYQVSFYVAEWYNAISSLALLIGGLLGIYWYLKHHKKFRQLRFPLGFLGMALIGVGSIAFHSTLINYYQALDELPMIYLGLICAYTIQWRGVILPSNEKVSQKAFYWRIGLIAYAVIFTIIYFYSKQFFLFFILSYAAIVAYIIIRSWFIAYRQHNRILLKEYWLAVGFYVGGMLIFWLPEHVFLPCEHWYQSIMPHAWFHLAVTIGTYGWLYFAIKDNDLLLENEKSIIKKAA